MSLPFKENKGREREGREERGERGREGERGERENDTLYFQLTRSVLA
jgi:hypothetical protein